jgi:hypothetical protein
MNKLIYCILLIALTIESTAQNRRSSTGTSATSPKASSVKYSAPATEEKPVKKSKIPKAEKTVTTKSKKAETEEPTEPSLESNAEASAGSSAKPFFSPPSEFSKMSSIIELGAYPSDADVSMFNIYALLGLNFDLSRRIYVGPYFKHKIMSTHSYQVMLIEGKTVDIASFNEWGGGISIGSYFPISSKFLLTPELRLGYNEYTMQDLSYTATNKNFLNHKYLSAMTRMNLGFKLSDYAILNLSGGYILPYYLKGNKTAAYDPGTFMYGIGVKFYMQAQ